MKLIAFILIYPFLWFVSVLPFPILYKLSDLVYFLVYYIIKYRKKSVRSQLKLTLPNYSKEELLQIEKKFYAHLCDLFLEMIKTMSISEKEIAKRFRFTNLEIIKDLELQKKSIALMCSHYASYEWIISLNNFIDFKGYAIYKKINNPYFDNLVRKIRLRFKANLVTTKE
ncbi:MAG: lipid A biosynthesis acyltransferase, partial [Methylotenera sp.]|nr:lipid A biosynthesis acyltransferase [Flavobacterium sp.]